MTQARIAWLIGLVSLAAVGAGCAAPAPPFKLQDTHGRPVALDGYRGAVVLLTFGPSW
jgi:cytochrome oxidase Cu insertion factor (SCO1/SenC/PrrC family)